MKVLVCGGRDYTNRATLYRVLDGIHASTPIALVIQGGATGADTLAFDWAGDRNVPQKTFNAEWAKYGAAAGPIRNKTMLADGQPDLVIAFPGGLGTANMVRQAAAAGVEVKRIRE